MIEVLNKDLSPIVDYIAVGDIFSETEIPLVLHNIGSTRAALMGQALQYSTSDGYERLFFALPCAPIFALGHSPLFLKSLSVTGGTVQAGDRFALRIEFESWAPGDFKHHYIGCEDIVAIDTISTDYNAIPVTTNLPVKHLTMHAYLRRQDNVWFSLPDAQIHHSKLRFSQLVAVAEPATIWGTQTIPGYVGNAAAAPQGSNIPTLAAGEYAPTIGVVKVSGGAESHNLLTLNPRRATFSVVGGEPL